MGVEKSGAALQTWGPRETSCWIHLRKKKKRKQSCLSKGCVLAFWQARFQSWPRAQDDIRSSQSPIRFWQILLEFWLIKRTTPLTSVHHFQIYLHRAPATHIHTLHICSSLREWSPLPQSRTSGCCYPFSSRASATQKRTVMAIQERQELPLCQPYNIFLRCLLGFNKTGMIL